MPTPVDPNLFHLMADQVQDYAIFLLSTQGNILSWNLGATAIKQYHASEVIGRHLRQAHRTRQAGGVADPGRG